MAQDLTYTTTNATEAADLPSGGIVLLGTVTGPRGPEALLRMGSGRIKKVVAGDRIGLIGLTHVLAVGDGQVHLSQGNKVEVLTMPGS